ncbi:hypothetical protein F441_10908 [Phytophthora nicotianae CJ01A1]|uniref:Short-chain dehydrogenase/reductase SDR n=4 Tax=Phytophthora nicotianae TaxID=4792 RepID=W2Z558_PHYNI|nr:hypothetical protein L915_10710 [Phytophthora nicotianae]ETO72959.1 hypothetical protein F444_11058 [Phytophthora nicotianae P1976]ETP14124.1 hypothetical protein F441_10908 [Phytophthora nicotianae CJ01A1]ETP42190.1 hypothetical protein F442_10882 [Phytophthora nicotianae P10297]ETL37755.1 hypothetical protein L916_10602 [Phytophthora nicotianae]
MADTKKTVLITGSTRGIGLALVEHYTKAGWNVIATARATSNTDKLMAFSPFKTVKLDTSDESSVLEAARDLNGVPIDLLINNAGVAQPTTFATATKESLMQQFEVNVTGPFLVTRALLPNLELAVKARGDAVVLQVSSVVGSISLNTEENAHMVRGHYGYVVSKAALNMVTRSLVLDLRERNIIVVAANPGFVDTEMNGHQGHIKPGDSAASMAKIVSEASLKDSGKFFDADPTTSTTELPW